MTLRQTTDKGIEYFQIPLYLQPDGVKLQYFKIRLFDLTEFIV